jgi:hypothetical protein
MDSQLAEIQQRYNDGFVTDEDITHLLERAKQTHLFQARYEEAREDLYDLRIQLDNLKTQVTELENNVFNVQ